jgi:hypothetical protein
MPVLRHPLTFSTMLSSKMAIAISLSVGLTSQV